jgi:hypothetical protein
MEQSYIIGPFEILAAHIERHKYRRGKFKGDAPLYPKRRWKSEIRVVRRPFNEIVVQMYSTFVQMYSTYLLTVTQDGTIRLNTDGWHSSPTTRQAMTEALYMCGVRISLYSSRFKGVSQPTLGAWRYYDGMTLKRDADGVWSPTELRPFQGKRVNREARASVRASAEDSGFLNLLPGLYAAAESHRDVGISVGRQGQWGAWITDVRHAEKWGDVVTFAKWAGAYSWHVRSTPRSFSETRAEIFKTIFSYSEFMETYDTDVTVL